MNTLSGYDLFKEKIHEHSTLNSIVFLLVSTIESYGLDYRPIIDEAGFDLNKNYHPTERVPTKKIQILWELSARYSNDPCFGLKFASYIQPSSLHGLGFSWLASCTLKEGLERLVRFQKIISTQRLFKLRKTQYGYCIFDVIKNKTVS